MTNLPSPSVLLGVPGFESWYPGQADAFNKIMEWVHSPARFMGLSLPTGSGKSCISMLVARMSGSRTVILTATKGLQDQLSADFGGIAVTVRGQNNFTCNLYPSMTADQAPCHEGLSCSYIRNGGCAYREQLKRAMEARIVITNYAYYLAQTRYSSGLGDFGLAVLDEGHMAFSALESHLNIHLNRFDLQSLELDFPTLPPTPTVPTTKRRAVKATTDAPEQSNDTENTEPDPQTIWQSWAELVLPSVQSLVDDYAAQIQDLHTTNDRVPGGLSRSYRTAKSVLAKLSSLSNTKEKLVIQRTNHGYLFTPRWVAGYGDALFQKVPKIMLMSAILSHKTADSLGVPSGEERAWLEVGSYFPPENTPIYHIPTTRVNYRTDDFGTTIWLSRIDQIIQRRLDRKGIIFTVSYDRARLLLANSRFKDIMLTHSTGDVTQVVNRFKQMGAPAVLVSPTVTTGWDFPGLDYILVGKIPYPDTKDPIVQARHEDDKTWTAFMAMDVLVQESGRGSRSSTDKCEVLILDDNFQWFWPAYRKYAPKWFRDRVKGSLSCVPEPLV